MIAKRSDITIRAPYAIGWALFRTLEFPPGTVDLVLTPALRTQRARTDITVAVA